MRNYTPHDWYWVVAGDESRFWSSAAGAYVAVLPEGAGVTRIDTEDSLAEVLRAYGLPGPVVQPEEVKAEAGRRIVLIMTDYQQRNALALGQEMVLTYGPDPALWPADKQATLAATMAKWDAIKAIRAKSDAIEVLEPIPADFRDDKYWGQ